MRRDYPHGVFKAPIELHEVTDESERFYQVNVIGADNCFQAALKHKIGRVVLSSSMEIAIGASWSSGGMGVIAENAPPRFDHFYNLNKLQAETTALYYCQTAGITSASLRYMEFSPRDKMEIGYGLLARSFLARDVARANLCAVESERIQCEPINIGPKTPLTNDDIVASRKDYDAVVEKHFPGAIGLIENDAQRRHRKVDLWPVATIDRARCWGGNPSGPSRLSSTRSGKNRADARVAEIRGSRSVDSSFSLDHFASRHSLFQKPQSRISPRA